MKWVNVIFVNRRMELKVVPAKLCTIAVKLVKRNTGQPIKEGNQFDSNHSFVALTNLGNQKSRKIQLKLGEQFRNFRFFKIC